jgi:outer membrane protein insertion porin family
MQLVGAHKPNLASRAIGFGSGCKRGVGIHGTGCAYRSAARSVLLLLAMATLLPVAALAGQASQFAGKRILEIQYSPQSSLDLADLAKAQPLKAGEVFRAEDIAKAIDGLFATGQFDDISVEAEASGEGVIVRFVTKPVWFIGGVSVEGKVTPPPSRDQIANTGQIALGTAFRDEDIATAVENAQRLMQANGFYEAQIVTQTERNPGTQQVFLTLQVTPGKRAKYDAPIAQGDKTLSEGTILRITGWRVPLIHLWRHVTDDRTRTGLEKLMAKYQNQERLTARVQLDKLDYDAARRRVRPSVTLAPGPKVKVRAVETKVSKSVLKRYVPIYEERAVFEDLLVEGKRNLQDYFQGRGYYDVDVEFRVQPERNDVQTIEYVIAKGDRYKLARVVISGNHYFDAATVRERMFMRPKAFNFRYGRYSEAFRRKDQETIADLYKSNGFRDVKVSSVVDRNYNGKPGMVAVTLNIEEGPQWLVDTVTIDGIENVDRDTLTAHMVSRSGQPFADANLAEDRNSVLTYYYQHGHPAADCKAQWRPSNTRNHVNVSYAVTEGMAQFVRGVLVSGLRTTRQRLIDKQVTLRAEDPLSPIEQTNIQKRLYDLGIFARVDTAVLNPAGDMAHKYILYDIEEANRYNVALGLGAQVGRFGTPSSTSLSSPNGSTGFSPEVSLDLNRQNFLGIGHTVSLRGVYSTLEKRASATYQQPRFFNSDTRSMSYSVLYDDSLNVLTFASKRTEASVQLSQKYSKSLTGLFRFAYRRVSVSSVIIPVLLVPQLVQPVRIGMFSTNLIQERRDNPTDPHHGMYNTADISLATRYFGSQRSLGRVLLRNATYYRLTPAIVLARQTQFGFITPFSAPAGVSEQQSVPLPERFFGGGADSLRAFPYNQAGPRDTGAILVAGGSASQPTGFPLGGNALFFNNVELRFPLLGENIQGVLFHDMGNVYGTLSDISFRFRQRNLQDFGYAAQAAGFGIRYRTPVGPVRLDLAYSLNPPKYQGFSGTPQQLLQCNPNAPPGSLPGYCRPSRQNVSHFQFFFSIGQTF